MEIDYVPEPPWADGTIGINIFSELEASTVTCVAICTGQRVAIDGVECVITSVDLNALTTRPVTDAD